MSIQHTQARFTAPSSLSTLRLPPLLQLLARPSVRHLKTVNTVDKYGQPLSVNAQQYAVLVTGGSRQLQRQQLAVCSPYAGPHQRPPPHSMHTECMCSVSCLIPITS